MGSKLSRCLNLFKKFINLEIYDLNYYEIYSRFHFEVKQLSITNQYKVLSFLMDFRTKVTDNDKKFGMVLNLMGDLQISRNVEHAVQYYLEAIKFGDSHAMFSLVKYYLSLKDIELKDEIVKNLELSSKKFHPAMMLYGTLYLDSIYVVQNVEKAVEFLMAGTNLIVDESVDNMFNFSDGYLKLGRIFLTKKVPDYTLSLYYFKKAADLNNPCGTYILGEHYENGFGVKKNIDLALNFYRIADSLGYKNASWQLAKLTSDPLDAVRRYVKIMRDTDDETMRLRCQKEISKLLENGGIESLLDHYIELYDKLKK